MTLGVVIDAESQCDYLMHSMLGLGASHLALYLPDAANIQEQAIGHRIKAVNGLNEAFMKPITSKFDADARFATLMNLTFQSACITDGLLDFMTMLRGCVLQGAMCRGIDTAFKAMSPDDHVTMMNNRFRQLNMDKFKMDTENLDKSMQSLNALEPYCKAGLEQTYLEMLQKLVQESYESPSGGKYSHINQLVGPALTGGQDTLHLQIFTTSSVSFTQMNSKGSLTLQILYARCLSAISSLSMSSPGPLPSLSARTGTQACCIT
jgi:hypothetical protein